RVAQEFRLIRDIGVQAGGERRVPALAQAGRMNLQICRQAAELNLTGGVRGGDQHPEVPWHLGIPSRSSSRSPCRCTGDSSLYIAHRVRDALLAEILRESPRAPAIMATRRHTHAMRMLMSDPPTPLH